MTFDMRVLNATGSRTLANFFWFCRHPIYATCWFLTGRTLRECCEQMSGW